MFVKQAISVFCVLLIAANITSCGTYYNKTSGAEKALRSGDYAKAEDVIVKNKFLNRKRNALLYYLELGKIQHLQGQFEESNKNLNRADDMMDQYSNVLDMALGATVNQAMQAYRVEGHERILVHYYKALNYLQLNNVEEALVEARRIDLSESRNEDAVNGKNKKYGSDPFGLMLMGMIYEADRDYNNAFIAYRNAKEVCNNDETGLYKNHVPESLERDLVRTAAYAGIAYDSKLVKEDLPFGEAIIFWENGLAPIKEEKNLFFTLDKKNGAFFFVSDNLTIPVDYNFAKDDPDFDPADIGMIRMAWSHYIQRPITMPTATLKHNNQPKNMYLLEDVTALAFQIEKDNYLKELAKNLLRITLKKISELSVAKQNEYAGLALGIANVASEKADTRNWQTLPSQISYARIPLKEGMNEISLSFPNGQSQVFRIEGKGGMVFRNVVTY